jgi:hypothetical protein
MDQTAVVEGGQYLGNPFAPCPGAVMAAILTNFFAGHAEVARSFDAPRRLFARAN